MSKNSGTARKAFLATRRTGFYIGAAMLVILSFSTVLLPRDIFIGLTSEDGFFENLGALFFGITSIAFLLLFFQRRKMANAADTAFFNTKGRRYFFLLLGLLFFVMVGEEISWGQRIIGFQTPEGMVETNRQGEFNFHNLSTFHHYGENKTLKKGVAAMFTAKKMFLALFLSYMLVLPLVYHRVGWLKRLIDRLYIPVPLIQIGVLFLFNSLIFRAFKLYYGYDKIGRSLSEVEEFNMALILLLLPLVWMSLPALGFSTKSSTTSEPHFD